MMNLMNEAKLAVLCSTQQQQVYEKKCHFSSTDESNVNGSVSDTYTRVTL